MENNIISADIKILISFLKKNKKRIFTQSDQVKKFENQWSKWLGVKYSVFVNSGSSANLLSMQIIKILFGSGEVIVPNLIGVEAIKAKTLLIQAGFLVKEFYDLDAAQPIGVVIRQAPEAGTAQTIGKSVTITINQQP